MDPTARNPDGGRVMGRVKRKRRQPRKFSERPIADQIDIYERALGELAKQIKETSTRVVGMARELQRIKRVAILGDGEEKHDGL